MTLGEFVKQYRDEHSLSLRDFAARAGLSAAYLSMLENNCNPRTGAAMAPKLETYKKISAASGVSFPDLFRIVEDDVDFSAGTEPMPQMRAVPRLGTIACGAPIMAEQNYDGFDTVPDFVRCDFTLICKGDSMTGARIYDGDVVCIRAQEAAENGQICAVLIDDETESGRATLKRVRFGEDGAVVLWPENPAYRPMVYVGDDVGRVHILGVATHFISTVR